MNPYERGQHNRRLVREWLGAPLAQVNKDFRLEALGRAFGLGIDYLREWVNNDASMGPYLQEEVVAWIGDHPDLQQNNPSYEETIFAKMRIE